MKRSIRTLLALATLVGAIFGTAGAASAADKATYYLSLGNSLADQGEVKHYPDQLFKLVRGEFTQLRLVKLGCGGENTDTMIYGGICAYPSGSQLDEAVAFLEAHVGTVPFITIDIGGNDGLACYDWDTGVWHNVCVEGELPHIESNLAYIIDALQEAAPGVPIAGMRYYDPFLGHWVEGEHGEDLARIDERALETLNAGLTSTYLSEGVLVADVDGPDFFNTADFTDMVITKEWGEVPVNVANACVWTLFCTTGDIHPNTAGYGVIAAAFEAVLPT